MITSAATSLRATAAVLGLFTRFVPFMDQAPCANSARCWLLRIGLYQLNRPTEQADDWVWMMDHTLQLGSYKCLVIIGIRLSSWDSRRPLTHEDMTLLNLTPMEHATGDLVSDQLQATVEKTGLPRAVVSDEGADLARAMKQFQEQRPEVRHQHDLKHKNALLLKKELTNDPRWAEFVQQANRTKLATTQTSLAFLSPPGMKPKARYMNLAPLISWAKRCLAYLADSRRSSTRSPDKQMLQKKLGWLTSYRSAIKRWSELMAIVKTSETIVQGGVHASICEQLRPQLKTIATTKAAQTLSESILAFLQAESSQLPPGEKLIGSTDVLESIIGRYKRIQSTHSKGGMTAMLLSLGAIVGRQTATVIQKGLETVRWKHVETWCETHLGQTLASQRRKISATKPA